MFSTIIVDYSQIIIGKIFSGKGFILPKISICIPTYNYAHFIVDAINSVLSQTFTDFELIIVDNCSTDNTKEIVEGYQKKDYRIRYFRNKSNIGLVGNLNRCISLAQCEFVKILCADDLLAPNCLERTLKVFDENPRVQLVASARLIVDEQLKPISVSAFSDTFQILNGFDVINRCLLHSNLIGEPSATMFRRKSAEKGFSEKYKQLSDLDMWLQLLEKGDFGFIPEPLCMFRRHSAQGTNLNIKSLAFADDEFLLLAEYLYKPYVTLPFFEKQKARYSKAYAIWRQRSAYPFRQMAAKISRNYSFVIFLVLLGVHKTKEFISRLITKKK